MPSHNIAARSREEREKINVDLAAAAIAFKERLNQPVIPMEVEMQQPERYREYFRERLQHYRGVSQQYPKGSDLVYQKEVKE